MFYYQIYLIYHINSIDPILNGIINNKTTILTITIKAYHKQPTNVLLNHIILTDVISKIYRDSPIKKSPEKPRSSPFFLPSENQSKNHMVDQHITRPGKRSQFAMKNHHFLWENQL